jgi:hypothetical protein
MPPYPQPRERHGIRYTLLEAPRPDRVVVAFRGPFLGQDTLWKATLLTIPRTATGSAYIEIGELTPEGRALTVGLDLPAIDEPVILRTIVMIRQYKRLRGGRHDFGEPSDG